MLSQRTSWLWIVGLLGFGWGCSPSAVQAPTISCTKNEDCGTGRLCWLSRCWTAGALPTLSKEKQVDREPPYAREDAGTNNEFSLSEEPNIPPEENPQVPEEPGNESFKEGPTEPQRSCQPGVTRSCYSGPDGTVGTGVCKAGTETCGPDGEWNGTCKGQVLPSTRDLCKEQDDDCNGSKNEGCQCKPGQEKECGKAVGECKKGKQACKNNGTWGTCTQANQPKSETCDGKDNNCNGEIDETFPKKGKSCTNGQGICRSNGMWVCSSDGKSLECDAQPNPSKTEECNGKDDDCDGSTDEGLKRNCSGNCGETQVCNKGTWTKCTGNSTPELCRNQKDDDCDNKVDEICGTPLIFANINKNKYITSARMLQKESTSEKKGILRHLFRKLTAFPCRHQKQDTFVMLATLVSTGKSAISYDCESDKFQVFVERGKGVNVVIPQKGEGIWGLVQSTEKTKECSKQKGCTIFGSEKGNVKVRMTSLGYYELTTKMCNDNTQPFFVTPYNHPKDQIRYSFIGKPSQGKCYVQILNEKGTPALGSFAFWFPDRTKVAYAYINASNKIGARNDFQDPNAKWTANFNNNKEYTVTYTGWLQGQKHSGVLMSPQYSSVYKDNHSKIKYQGMVRDWVTNGVKVGMEGIALNNRQRIDNPFFLLFIQ